MSIFEIIFWLSATGIVSSYIFYPVGILLINNLFPKKKANNTLKDFPTVEIAFAAYNEESVIEEKIKSCFNSHYPAHKIRVTVGSDNSTDRTNEIVRNLQYEYENLELVVFESRSGKSKIINSLVQHSQSDLMLLCDANIIFSPSLVSELVKSIQSHEKVAAVGGHIVYTGQTKKGIGMQENTYLNLENQIKQAESDQFQSIIGMEGGCYMIKREVFPKIPPLFFMEDFYVNMQLLFSGYKVLFNSSAICYEDVSTESREEYKRKVRISIGNYQNLMRFKYKILQHLFPVGLLFIFHKVLRWLTPFFLIILLISLTFIYTHSPFYLFATIIYSVFLTLSVLGIVFSRSSRIKMLKYPGHFIYMNIALIAGFFKYLKGVKTNAWQPTKRNQD